MESWKLELYYGSGELCHHGIKGQKWGVRRFQNEDGTLTSEGKRHALSNAAKTAQNYSGKAMEKVVDGRKLFANKEERIARGRELKAEGRNMVNSYFRMTGRGILASLIATPINMVMGAAGFTAGQRALNAALSAYGTMSTIRFIQDVRDINAYNKDQAQKKLGK